jgi:O-antigen ligase
VGSFELYTITMPVPATVAPANRIASTILFAVVAGAPLPFGSSSTLPITFWCALLGAGLVTASPRDLTRNRGIILAAAFAVSAAWLFVVHEQLSEHPWLATPHPIWMRASAALGKDLEPSASIARGQPWFALGASIADMLALMLGLVVGNNREHARRMLHVIAWSGAAYALYGILALAFDPTSILWREKVAYIGNLTATFINRNTAAAYFGSCSVVWLLLLLAQRKHGQPSGRMLLALFSQRFAGESAKLWIPLCGFMLCITAMFLTGSRAGVVLSLFALAVAFSVEMGRQSSRRRGILVAIAASALAALLLLELLGGSVNDRFSSQGLVDTGRLNSYRAIAGMIADRPWFGSGLGTFPWAYAAYRSADVSMRGIWDIGHNTPLEIAVELGMPLATLIVIGWAGIVGTLIHGVRTRKRDRIVPLAALSVTLIAVLHSMVDFSLQIPGFSIVACALAGTGLAQSFRSEPSKMEGRLAVAARPMPQASRPAGESAFVRRELL